MQVKSFVAGLTLMLFLCASAGGQGFPHFDYSDLPEENESQVQDTQSGPSTSGPRIIEVQPERVQPQEADHSLFVKRFGVGLLGTNHLPIPSCSAFTSNVNNLRLDAHRSQICRQAGMSLPMIGIRYWASERVGLEAALGVGMKTLSLKESSRLNSIEEYRESELSRDDFTYIGGSLRLGLPIALANSGYFSFQFTPHLHFGYARGSFKDDSWTSPDNLEVIVSAWNAGLGARIGAEIHFGFMGLPQLSLQGGVGLEASFTQQNFLERTTTPEFDDFVKNEKRGSAGSWNVSTSRLGNPWDIFTGQVSAIYYF